MFKALIHLINGICHNQCGYDYTSEFPKNRIQGNCWVDKKLICSDYSRIPENKIPCKGNIICLEQWAHEDGPHEWIYSYQRHFYYWSDNFCLLPTKKGLKK